MNSRHIACKLCRERKVRCPGQQPVCDRCRRAGEECVYLPAQRQSKGGSHLAETVEALQKRLDEAEALILSMNGHSGSTMAGPSSFAYTGWPTTPDFTTLAAPGLTLPSGSTSSLGINQHDLVYQHSSGPQPHLVTTSERGAPGQNGLQDSEAMDFDIDLSFNQLTDPQPQPAVTQPSSTSSPPTTTSTPSASASTILTPLAAYCSSVIRRESEVAGLAASVADYLAWMRNVPYNGAPPATNAVFQTMLENIEIRARELVEISQRGHDEPMKELLGALAGDGTGSEMAAKVAELEEKLERQRREHSAFFKTEYDACKFLKEQMRKRP
ncbi:hypothetical protein GE09DRAFT_1217106 [Coniochaeta sp. 2T2.1]|nr:hypothetical protein GE09DRAFT_1217106 [Coniochaeta sp. 2T2.1]